MEANESEKELLGDVKNLTEQKELQEDENMINYQQYQKELKSKNAEIEDLKEQM